MGACTSMMINNGTASAKVQAAKHNARTFARALLMPATGAAIVSGAVSASTVVSICRAVSSVAAGTATAMQKICAVHDTSAKPAMTGFSWHRTADHYCPLLPAAVACVGWECMHACMLIIAAPPSRPDGCACGNGSAASAALRTTNRCLLRTTVLLAACAAECCRNCCQAWFAPAGPSGRRGAASLC